MMQTRTGEMLHMLDSPNPAIRARALLLLGHEQHMLPFEKLTQLYEDGDSEMRLAALKYLARNLPPGHTKIALKGLTDSANSIKVTAVQHLISFPDREAAPILEMMLTSPDFPRKDLIIRALEACNDGRALRLLLPILEDEHHPSRMLASNTIGRLGVHTVIHKVLQLLASDDEMTVRMAIAALAYFKEDLIIAPVLTVIEKWRSTPKSSLIHEAVSLLDKFHDSRIRDALLQSLLANNVVLDVYGDLARITAIHILANYPDPQVIQYLIGLLQNGSQSDRYATTYAFTKIGGKEAVDALLSTCPLETNPLILSNYSSAFATLRDKRAVPMLEAILERADALHRSTIEFNLRALNPLPPKPIHTNLLTRLKSRLHPFR